MGPRPALAFFHTFSVSGRAASALLDKAAQDLNISRQALINTLVRQALDQHCFPVPMPRLFANVCIGAL